MKKLPLLARAFEDQTIDSFYAHAKDLMKTKKPEVKITKTRKKKNTNDNTSGPNPDPEANRETETHVGIIEVT